jgi:ADP-heptose:LPS heptosyltransferase
MMETNGATAGIVVRGRDKERRCLANPSRIVIWRPDHLGDLVLFSGLLRHFRRRWPSAHITLGVRSYGRALYAHCPYVDEMYPCEDGFSTFRAVPSPPGLDWLVRRYHQRRNRERGTNYGRFRDALRSDLTIFPIVSPGWRNHILLALMPSKARVGICGNLANQSHRTDLASRPLYDAQMDVSRMPRYYPEMEINRQFMAFLGIDVDAEQLWPEFWTAPADAETAKNLMDGSRSRLTLGIAPGVSSPKGKQLSAEWYAESLAGIDLSHFDIVLLGGKPDLSVCEQLAALLRLRTNAGGVLDLAGKTSILQLIECVRLCDRRSASLSSASWAVGNTGASSLGAIRRPPAPSISQWIAMAATGTANTRRCAASRRSRPPPPPR